ncbi:hypothetical protein TNCV_1836171 [Trichonephila clavipes]|nr:hypothetical protein TNCV_1836171 [Trichonephila clavipes]
MLELDSDEGLLHQDNDPAPTALSVKKFLTSKNIIVMKHPLYSPDLAPCDFVFFPTVKSCLKGTHFTSVEEVKWAETKDLLIGLPTVSRCIAVTSNDSTENGTTLKVILSQRTDSEGPMIYRTRLILCVYQTSYLFKNKTGYLVNFAPKMI